MTVKITQKNLPSLPDGVYGIEPNFYVRVREGKINFFFSYTKDGKWALSRPLQPFDPCG